MSTTDIPELDDSIKEEIDTLRQLLTSLDKQGIDVRQVIREKLATEFAQGWTPDEDLESEVKDILTEMQPIWRKIFEMSSQREDVLALIRERIENEFSKAWE